MATPSSNNYYEAVVILNPETALEEQKNLFQKNKGIIESFNGSIFSVDTWGKRNLANQIKKTKKGIYFLTMFEAQPGAVAELERTMGINDKVLRFMHTKLDNRVSLTKHYEAFKSGLQESIAREKEKEAKMAAKRAAAQASAASS